MTESNESPAIRELLDALSTMPPRRRDFAPRTIALTAFCDAHLDDNDADNDASIYAAARCALLRLRALINSADDLDADDILDATLLLHDIDSFILDESR